MKNVFAPIFRARARTLPASGRSAFPNIHLCPSSSGATGKLGGLQGRGHQGALRVFWLLDPATGRLECRWAPEEEMTDRRQNLSGRQRLGCARGADAERMAA